MSKRKLDEKVVEMYDKEMLPCSVIAKKYGTSRTAVWNYLKARGVDTSNRLRESKCDQCGKEIKRPRGQIRDRIHHFCSNECYWKFIKNDNYQDSRHGCRIGKEVISKVLNIYVYQKGVVHHVDGDDYNNDIKNLWMFKNHSDHMKYHRYGGPVEAWIGSKQEWQEVKRT